MPRRTPYKEWAIVPADPNNADTEWIAQCNRCPWTMRRPTYISARAATMYHYYSCPKRFELVDDLDDSA